MRKHLNFPVKPWGALLALLLLTLCASTVLAQTNRPATKSKVPPPEGNRFLFIVDTSNSMKKGANDVLRVIGEIIHSSASGQLHKGDTLGVWTFNKELYPGQLPLQTWSPDDLDEIGLRTMEFLKQQHCEGESRLDKALAGMYTVIKSSDIITVFLISNGQGRMQGTPFDDEINSLYAESIKEMKKDRKPIVTVLQAKSGKVVKYTVNALPWPVIIPEVPIPIKTAQTATEPKVTPVTSNSASYFKLPPLVLSTNRTPKVKPIATVPPPAATPAPTVVAQPKPVAPVIVPPPTLPTPAPTPVELAKVEPVATKPPEPAPAPRPIPAAISNKTIAAPTQPPINDGEPIVNPVTLATNTTTAHKIATTGVKPKREPVTNEAPAVQAAALPPEGSGRSKSFLIAAIALAVIGFGLIALLIYRSRASSNTSLISHTMGNPPRK